MTVDWSVVYDGLLALVGRRQAYARWTPPMSDAWMRRHGYLPAPLSLRRRLLGAVIGRWKEARRG